MCKSVAFFRNIHSIENTRLPFWNVFNSRLSVEEPEIKINK